MPDVPSRPGPDPDLPGAEGGALAELVRRLRGAGLDPDSEGLSDALWLARWTRPAAGAEPDGPPGPGSATRAGPPRAAAGEAGVPRQSPWEAVATPDSPGDADRSAPVPAAAAGADRRLSLHPVPQRQGAGQGGAAGRIAGVPVGVPAAPALPAPLELQRALRPLQAYRSAAPPLRVALDETSTAEQSARAGGLVLPVYRAVTRGDARLQLVLEASASMRVWDRLFDELVQVFGQLGAFGDIQVSHLHIGHDGSAVVSRSADVHAAPLHTTDRLSDPTGRRITVLVSDCVGPVWHSGRAQRLLHQLSRQGPVAVLQPLPQRMWDRTRLPVRYGELSRGETLGGAGRLRVRTTAGVVSGGPGAVAVPVLPPEPMALGAWARLLSGIGGPVPGAVGWVRADQPAAAPVSRRRTAPPPVKRVRNFRSGASPRAYRLAVYLAAAPLCLPVMQLVQRAMLPDSGPADLAEVLLSGLVTSVRDNHGGRGSDGTQWFEMEPGVQETLLESLGRDEAVLVLEHCSKYIELRFRRGGVNFPALALVQLGDGRTGGRTDSDIGGHTDGDGGGTGHGGGRGDGGGAALIPQPFAEVAARVLERFMPLPEQFRPYGRDAAAHPGEPPAGQVVGRARALLARFDAGGMVQDLIDAVRLLRGATGLDVGPAAADPELWAAYATCALRLWEVQRGAELLREAEEAARRAVAVAHPAARRERAVLARVLRAAAGDRGSRGDREGALGLLRRADREYAAACATPGLDEGEALRLTLERAGALEAQWELGGGRAPLQSATGVLEAFADAWPDHRPGPPELPLARGRLLLRLAGATSDPEEARGYAEQSARSLRTVVDPGTGVGPLPAPERVRVLLDLVDALLASDGDLDEARQRVETGLALTRDQSTRADLLVRAGRIERARYAGSGEPRELRAAVDRFARAALTMPRDASAHADVLAEWGEALLRQAAAETGPGSFEPLTQAIRVLRDCRAETPSGSPALAPRLFLLGRGLMLRYRARGDRVDLREAEYLLGLAAAEAVDPLLSARCLLELGQAQFEAYRSLGRPSRLDEAVDSFRAAAEAARNAESAVGSDAGSGVGSGVGSARARQEAVELGAQAHHWRGMSYEAATRPRAAREAYRAARAEWARLPDDRVGTGEPTARRTAQRLAELEQG
ncbi:SAV_2336 N-terminal domain-related protein [Streptomyces fuscichromogenes]|uniref:SAV_2336 N-terminal domain-related protein n=1 Tax=Streptomyces fuscichromogenes TaxID=1324013 RepID=UPI003818D5CE